MKIGRFPEVVNENAARLVALIVCSFSIFAIIQPSYWILLPLLYGFAARVLYGPDFSPAAQFVLKVVIPFFKISNRPTAGVPKRFAQFIGLTFTLTAVIFYTFGWNFEFEIIIGTLAFFAMLEAVFGFCAGCFVFTYLMKWGFIPQSTCERCANLQFENKII